MNVTLRMTEYLAKAVDALENDRLGSEWKSDGCPECGEVVEFGQSYAGDHLIWRDTKAGQDVILVGCEGYFVINPEILGLDPEAWQPAES